MASRSDSGAHPYDKCGEINGMSIKVLIDTGSHYSLIKKIVAEKYGLPITYVANRLFRLGDVNVPSVVTIGEINSTIIVDGVDARPVKLLVLPDTAQRPDVIVGRNWLDDPEVTYWKENGQMKLIKTNGHVGVKDASAMRVDQQFDVLQVVVLEGNVVKRRLTKDNFKYINEEVTDSERQDLMNLVNEYRYCFALNLQELGCTKLTTVDLQEVQGSFPIVCRPYRTTAADREAIAEIVADWKKHGIVTDTKSLYASPVILVKQGDKNRLYIDYRQLNKQVKRHNFPLPDLQEQVEALVTGKFFVQLDMATRYLQLPLSESAQEKTAFVTPDDTGQFTRMPFGLAGAPGEFTRLMHRVLGKLRNTVVKNYLDDWFIDAASWTEMLVKLKEVLECLKGANLTLKPSKCWFGAREIEFLGFVIKEGTIRPGSGKTKTIRDFAVPRDVHGVRRFLGLTGFFRRFVASYATIALPLTNLTKGGTRFTWEEPQQGTFEELKNALIHTPVMDMFDSTAYSTEVPHGCECSRSWRNDVAAKYEWGCTKVGILYQ